MKAPIMDERSQKEQDEYYGPIDGVRPLDWPETYLVLNISKCMKNVGQRIIFVKNRYPWKRLCENCYLQRGQPESFNMKTVWHSLCSPLHGLTLDTKLKCARCNNVVIKFKQARTCRECIEQFLIKRIKFEIEFYLEKHLEIEVDVRTH